MRIDQIEIAAGKEVVTEVASTGHALLAGLHGGEIATPALAQSSSAIGNDFLAASHSPATPAIKESNRLGVMLTRDRIERFADDMFVRKQSWNQDFQKESNRVDSATTNYLTAWSRADIAMSNAGIDFNPTKGFDSAEVHRRLSGEPVADRMFTNFLKARREYFDAGSAIDRMVARPRLASVHHAVNSLANEAGIFVPRLNYQRVADALAMYMDGTMTLSKELMRNPFTRRITGMTAHELTHEEHEILSVASLADAAGIGSSFTRSHVAAIRGALRETGLVTSPRTISTILTLRDARLLTDEAAEVAHDTMKSTAEVLAAQKLDGPAVARGTVISEYYHRAESGGSTSIVAELVDPKRGLSLSRILFGEAAGAEKQVAYQQQFGRLANRQRWPQTDKDAAEDAIFYDLGNSMTALNREREPYLRLYENSAHENIANKNQSIAESRDFVREMNGWTGP